MDPRGYRICAVIHQLVWLRWHQLSHRAGGIFRSCATACSLSYRSRGTLFSGLGAPSAGALAQKLDDLIADVITTTTFPIMPAKASARFSRIDRARLAIVAGSLNELRMPPSEGPDCRRPRVCARQHGARTGRAGVQSRQAPGVPVRGWCSRISGWARASRSTSIMPGRRGQLRPTM